MVTKKQLLSKLDDSQGKFEAAIDNASLRVFRHNHLLSFLKNNESLESNFGITSTASDDVNIIFAGQESFEKGEIPDAPTRNPIFVENP